MAALSVEPETSLHRRLLSSPSERRPGVSAAMKAKVRDVGRVPKFREARSLGWRQYDARAQITTRAFDDEEQEYSMSVIGPPTTTGKAVVASRSACRRSPRRTISEMVSWRQGPRFRVELVVRLRVRWRYLRRREAVEYNGDEPLCSLLGQRLLPEKAA
jgi:hypothetical protein